MVDQRKVIFYECETTAGNITWNFIGALVPPVLLPLKAVLARTQNVK